MGFKDALDKFAAYRDISRPSIDHATVDVTEETARKKLKLKKKDPLEYKGLRLTCRGSRAWRNRQDDVRLWSADPAFTRRTAQ